jgi:putative ABC transport system permease protein
MMMDRWLQDARYALRQMTRRPGFTVVMVLTLALGIGANTAVFSVVNGVVLQPLPYPEADRLTAVWSQFPSMELMEFPSSWPEYDDYRAASSSYEELGIWGRTQRTLTGGESPERLDVAYFSWTMFPVLGVDPALGRAFGSDEDVAGRDDVVVLSHALWERRFGADPSVVGGTVELDGATTTVLGVMGEGFAFPDPDTDAWVPAGVDPADPPGRANHFAQILGRLAPGVTLEAAEEELGRLVQGWDSDEGRGHSWSSTGHPAFLRPLHQDVVGDVRASLLVLLGAVGLVLLIACANVANLLLVRAEGRTREISLRSAMGAGRARIIGQLVVESMMLAALGGVAGVAVARLALASLLSAAPTDLPRLEGVTLDGSVLGFTAAVTLASGLFFGLAPAFRALRTDLATTLHSAGGRGGTAGRERFRLRGVLVVGQTALAVMLLIGGGLLLRSFGNLTSVDPGFRAESVLSASLSLPTTAYPEGADVTRFYADLLDRVESIPGVTSAALVRTPPLTGSLPPNDIEFESRPSNPDDPPLNADIQVASAGYFETMDIPVLTGRAFDGTDHETTEVVAVVDEPFVRRFFGEASDALGARVRQPGAPEFARIVGVVGAVHQEELGTEPRAHLYLLHAQSPRTWFPIRGMSVLARTDREAATLTSALRDGVRGLDPNLPVFGETTVRETLRSSMATERFSLFLQLVFAAVALSLAAVGIYGVLSHQVQQRTREIGIRLALGAERPRIVGLVVGQGMRLVVVAVLVGVGGALAVARALSSLLYGVSATDPLTYGAVTIVLGVVAALACWLPAHRASSVDPQAALRAE